MQNNQVEFLSDEMINFLTEVVGNATYGLCPKCPLYSKPQCWNHPHLSCMEMWRNYFRGVKSEIQLSSAKEKSTCYVKIKCNECGRTVSTEIPDSTVIRAWVECLECIENNKNKNKKRGKSR